MPSPADQQPNIFFLRQPSSFGVCSGIKLMDHLARVARRRRLADATVGAYSSWVRNYLAFSANVRGGWVPPKQLHTADVEAFLNHPVIDKSLSASSQNQALSGGWL